MEASPDYTQIGRFIYGTARLESELAGLLRLAGQDKVEDAELAANARQAGAMLAASAQQVRRFGHIVESLLRKG